MELLTAIGTRTSAGRLREPGPSAEHLALILDAADRAPDHGRLKPWRLIVLEGEVRQAFATAAAAAKRARQPLLSDQQFADERTKFLRSPLVVVIGCAVQRQAQVPEIEQVTATAAAAENFFLAAHALGYGVMWKTGAAAYDAGVKGTLGLRTDDHVVGIMHLGTRLN